MTVPKVILNLTIEEMREIVESFTDLLHDPRVTSASLYFDPVRFTTTFMTLKEGVHPFIAVGRDPLPRKEE